MPKKHEHKIIVHIMEDLGTCELFVRAECKCGKRLNEKEINQILTEHHKSKVNQIG